MRSLGRYQLETVLGKGGAGEVWKATLCGPGGFRKPVAIKLIRSDVEGSALRDESFVREARLGALLSHPNIVSTYELGQADGVRFISMEWVPGPSMLALLRDRLLSPRAVLDIAIQTCAGLDHIHRLRVDGAPHGLVHRDIKPGNLLVTPAGQVKVADLGIARLVAEKVADELIAGTPGYMAPEQLRGEEDGRADLFALGMTIYVGLVRRMLLGRGRDALKRLAHLDQHLDQALDDQVDDLMPGLTAVLRGCLAPDPAHRFGSARDLAAALRPLYASVGGDDLAAVLRRHQPPVEPPADTPSETPRSLSRPTTILRPADAFLGRERDLSRVVRSVRRSAGWWTLTGPAGVGKTRLALEVAAQVDLPGGTWLCQMEDAHTMHGMCAAVGRTLGVPVRRGDPVTAVGRALGGLGRALVVLDNLEQLADHAPLFEQWRTLAPEVSFLATSRVDIALRPRTRVVVAPLSIDDGVALYLARARRAPEPQEREAVRTLVERVDALPLAIELAAARSARLTPDELLIGLPSARALRATARQQGLWASLEASWALLDHHERAALAQFSVFEGGATAEATAAVIRLDDDAPWVVDLLNALARQSLLVWDRRTERYRILQTIKDFAASKLGDPQAAYERHWRWYGQLGTPEAVDERWRSPEATAAADAEIDNLVAAARRATAAGDRSAQVNAVHAAWPTLRLTGPLELASELVESLADDQASARTWLVVAQSRRNRGHAEAALEALDRADAVMDDTDAATRARALDMRGIVLYTRGRRDEAIALLEPALRFAYGHGLVAEAGQIRFSLGSCMRQLRRHDEALAHFMSDLRAMDDLKLLRTATAMRSQLGLVELNRGRLKEAKEYLKGATKANEVQRDFYNLGASAGNLGLVYRMLGEWARAEQLIRQAVAVGRRIGEPLNLSINLCNLADVLIERGRGDEAIELVDEARGLAIDAELRMETTFGALEGWRWLRSGNAERALPHLEAAVAALRAADKRHDSEDWMRLAEAQLELGRFAEARRTLSEAIDIATRTANPQQQVQAWATMAVSQELEGLRPAAKSALAQAQAIARTAQITAQSTPGQWLRRAQHMMASGR